MWQQIVAWFRLLWGMSDDVQRLRSDVRDLQLGEQYTHDFMTALAAQNELLRKDNDMLRRELEIERERSVNESEKMELRLRLQISEELRLHPSDEKR